jgi:hypothetical protein
MNKIRALSLWELVERAERQKAANARQKNPAERPGGRRQDPVYWLADATGIRTEGSTPIEFTCPVVANRAIITDVVWGKQIHNA